MIQVISLIGALVILAAYLAKLYASSANPTVPIFFSISSAPAHSPVSPSLSASGVFC